MNYHQVEEESINNIAKSWITAQVNQININFHEQYVYLGIIEGYYIVLFKKELWGNSLTPLDHASVKVETLQFTKSSLIL